MLLCSGKVRGPDPIIHQGREKWSREGKEEVLLMERPSHRIYKGKGGGKVLL